MEQIIKIIALIICALMGALLGLRLGREIGNRERLSYKTIVGYSAWGASVAAIILNI